MCRVSSQTLKLYGNCLRQKVGARATFNMDLWQKKMMAVTAAVNAVVATVIAVGASLIKNDPKNKLTITTYSFA